MLWECDLTAFHNSEPNLTLKATINVPQKQIELYFVRSRFNACRNAAWVII